MIAYKQLLEVGILQDKLVTMNDDILDLYKINPEKCKTLLKELLKINMELQDLEKEFQKIEDIQ